MILSVSDLANRKVSKEEGADSEPANLPRFFQLAEAATTNRSHGNYAENAKRICDVYNTLHPSSRQLTPEAYTDLMIVTKLVRDGNSPNYDNLVDIAGYAGLKAEALSNDRNNRAEHSTKEQTNG